MQPDFVGLPEVFRRHLRQNQITNWFGLFTKLAEIPTDAVEFVKSNGNIGSLPNLPVPMAMHGAIAMNDEEILIVARHVVWFLLYFTCPVL